MAKPDLKLIKGGKCGEAGTSLSVLLQDFNLTGILGSETIDIEALLNNITPEMHGRTIQGVTYGDPADGPSENFLDDPGLFPR